MAVTVILLAVVGMILFKELAEKPVAPKPDIEKVIAPKQNRPQQDVSERQSKLIARRERLRSKRSQPKISNKGLVEVDAISEQLTRIENPKDKVDLLDQLWEVDDKALPKLVLEQLDDKNQEVRMAAIELLDNKKEGEILACINKALDDPDKNVREFAVVLLGDTEEKENTKTLLLKGVDDSSEDVRAAAFDVLGVRSPKEKEYVFAQSIASPYKDVKNNTVDLLMDIPSHTTIKILFQGLNDNDGDFRELVQDKIQFLVSQDFKNYNDAISWWEKNKNKYDDELFEK